jgi:hypothetical protein
MVTLIPCVVINVRMSLRYSPSTSVDFKGTPVFSADFNKPVIQHNFTKICPMGANLFYADEWTDRHGEAYNRFSQLCEKHLNISKRTVLAKVWGVEFRTAVHQWRGRVRDCGSAGEVRQNCRPLKINP